MAESSEYIHFLSAIIRRTVLQIIQMGIHLRHVVHDPWMFVIGMLEGITRPSKNVHLPVIESGHKAGYGVMREQLLFWI